MLVHERESPIVERRGVRRAPYLDAAIQCDGLIVEHCHVRHDLPHIVRIVFAGSSTKLDMFSVSIYIESDFMVASDDNFGLMWQSTKPVID